MLTITDMIPAGFLSARAADLGRILDGPTLIHLPGLRNEPLFVSILLHGNEDVGLVAVQQALARLHGRPLPRSLSLFVGNVEAARCGLRRMPHQPDYNRIWPGADVATSAESDMMFHVVNMMRVRKVFASIDLHNNTGHNPHYTCVARLDQTHLQLASLFGPTAVYFRTPLGVQTRAFAELCPSVTCECGRVGDVAGADHAALFIEACLHLHEIPNRPVPTGDLHLFHTVATMRIPEGVTFGYGNSDCDVNFVSDLDLLNFTELKPGRLLGRHRLERDAPVIIEDEDGQRVTERFLDFSNGMIRMKRETMPSMLTCDPVVVRQDCLGYLMERYPIPGHGSKS